MTSFTISSITESFPNSSLPKFKGEPTYKTIKEVEHLLIENVSSIQLILGGSNHGYLGLILSSAKYLIVTDYNYIGYANPGALLIFPTNAYNIKSYKKMPHIKMNSDYGEKNK